jgi:choline transport protein
METTTSIEKRAEAPGRLGVEEISTDLDSGALAHSQNTSTDDSDMKRLGRKQEFRRMFSSVSVLGMTATIMVTWEASLITMGPTFIDGGLPAAVYTFLWTFMFWVFIVISMCDMASMAPSSGAQYHWVSEFAPKSQQKRLSFMIGWLSALSWQSGLAGACYLMATIIQGLIVLNHDSYQPQRWHSTLLTMAIAVFCCLFNTYGARLLPLFDLIVLVLHIGAFFGILATLWAKSDGNRNTAHQVFAEFRNTGGWATTGTAVIIGQVAPIFAFVGPDAAAHISEEVRDASRTIPRMMIAGILLNGVLGVVMMITFCFCVTDLAGTLASPTGMPMIDVFHRVTGSKAAATGMSVLVLVITFNAPNGILMVAARQLFAFARDNGVPFSPFFRKVFYALVPPESDSHGEPHRLADPGLRFLQMLQLLH